MKKILSTLVFAACINAPLTCLSQTETNEANVGKTNAVALTDADGRVAALLRESGTKFMIDQDGDFEIRCHFSDDDQLQNVYVSSTTSTFDKVEVRQIWSIVYTSDEPFTADFTERLLERNSVVKIGSWFVSRQKEKYILIFSVKVEAPEQKASSLDSIIDFVAITANGMANDIKKAQNTNTRIWSPYDKPKTQL